MNFRYLSHQHKGFTLIDMLVAITIMTIVGYLGLSYNTKTLAKNRLISAAELTISVLDQTRTKSIGGISGSSWAMEIVSTDPVILRQYCFSCDPGNEQIKETTFSDEISITPPPTGNIIIFANLSGYTYSPTLSDQVSDELTLTLRNPNHSINIFIPPSGKIYMDTIQ